GLMPLWVPQLTDPEVSTAAVFFLPGLFSLALVLYVFGFLQCALNSAVAGELPHACWPGVDVLLLGKSFARWSVTFLAGPAGVAGACFAYWLWCGDPEFVDVLILAELIFLAVGYWLLALLAVTRSNRLQDANPLLVARLISSLGYRAGVAALLAFLVVVFHGRMLLWALDKVHQPNESTFGWLMLIFWWFSALFCATFLMRLAGSWYFRFGRKRLATEAPAPV